MDATNRRLDHDHEAKEGSGMTAQSADETPTQQHIDRLVAQAPPLTAQQRAALATLFADALPSRDQSGKPSAGAR